MSTSPNGSGLARGGNGTCLVTGGGGFIGSNLADRLLGPGADRPTSSSVPDAPQCRCGR